jgi:hypothetical protein
VSGDRDARQDAALIIFDIASQAAILSVNRECRDEHDAGGKAHRDE